MAGFDNRYGTEYGGLAAQMAGVESGRQGARTRRLGLEIDNERFGRSMDQVERDAEAATARAASGSVDSQLALARLFSDQSQHKDKMGIDRARLSLDTQKAGFEMNKMSAETALLQQEFAGIEQVAATVNNPLVAALARAGQLDKAENVQRALLAQGVAEGRFTDDDVVRFNAAQGTFIGENQAASIADREGVAQRNLANNMMLEQVKGTGKGGSAGKIPGGSGELPRDMIKLITGIDPVEEGSRVLLTGSPDDKATAMYDFWRSLPPRKQAVTLDAMDAAGSVEEQMQIFNDALGMDGKEFWSDQATGMNAFGRFMSDRFGSGEAIVDRKSPSEDELATALADGNPKDMEILAQKYPEWWTAYQEDIALKAKDPRYYERGFIENSALNMGQFLQFAFGPSEERQAAAAAKPSGNERPISNNDLVMMMARGASFGR